MVEAREITVEKVSVQDLQDAWNLLTPQERVAHLMALERRDADEFFLRLPTRDQAGLVCELPTPEARSMLRLLAPDDAADLVQHIPQADREGALGLLDDPTRREVQGLLAYAEDAAGGIMNPRYARLRPEMTVDEAIAYLRKQARERSEPLHYGYVLDPEDHLLGVVTFRRLFGATPSQSVSEIMEVNPVTVSEHAHQEEVSRLFERSRVLAIPVVDEAGRMRGIVTADDIVDVVREEATRDIQKLGGTEALDAPYFQISLGRMLRKRAGWLSALFLGEMLTATAMGYYEAEVARAVILALFVPLVISSGGNSGSQATTLVIRAMALGEVRLGQWWRVVRREFISGAGLGLILGSIGVARILVWQLLFHTYGAHAPIVAATVGVSLLGVVLWGTLVGSMLPFLLRRLGFDPASASAPFVATLVDVTGLIIYFSTAKVIMAGSLL